MQHTIVLPPKTCANRDPRTGFLFVTNRGMQTDRTISDNAPLVERGDCHSHRECNDRALIMTCLILAWQECRVSRDQARCYLLVFRRGCNPKTPILLSIPSRGYGGGIAQSGEQYRRLVVKWLRSNRLVIKVILSVAVIPNELGMPFSGLEYCCHSQ